MSFSIVYMYISLKQVNLTRSSR